MEPEQIIANFLKPPSEGGAYTDEKLAALLAHAEDGRLSYHSCCCLRGLPTAKHALRGTDLHGSPLDHGDDVVRSPEYLRADEAYWLLGDPELGRIFSEADERRRAKLIPLIKSEMSRRESLRSQTEVSEVVMV